MSCSSHPSLTTASLLRSARYSPRNLQSLVDGCREANVAGIPDDRDRRSACILHARQVHLGSVGRAILDGNQLPRPFVRGVVLSGRVADTVMIADRIGILSHVSKRAPRACGARRRAFSLEFRPSAAQTAACVNPAPPHRPCPLRIRHCPLWPSCGTSRCAGRCLVSVSTPAQSTRQSIPRAASNSSSSFEHGGAPLEGST